MMVPSREVSFTLKRRLEVSLSLLKSDNNYDVWTMTPMTAVEAVICLN